MFKTLTMQVDWAYKLLKMHFPEKSYKITGGVRRTRTKFEQEF